MNFSFVFISVGTAIEFEAADYWGIWALGSFAITTANSDVFLVLLFLQFICLWSEISNEYKEIYKWFDWGIGD